MDPKKGLIDVIKWEMQPSIFCHKFPSNDLSTGTQLVVYPGQTAFFVNGGQIYDSFTSGTYTLKSLNIPLLDKVLNLPFGGETPFQAEVWFVNQTAKLDLKWGTPNPLQLEDPRYHIIVPVGAYGQYGVRVSNPRRFLEGLIGNMANFTQEQIVSYFKGKIVTHLNTLIAQKIAKDKISLLDINMHLLEMSAFCNEQLNARFQNYGITLLDFYIMAVTIPNEDPSLIRLKEAKDMAAKIQTIGRDIYQMERSYDVLEAAASNEGAGGQMLAMGSGLGVGLGVGNVMGNMATQYLNTGTPMPPPLPTVSETYHIAVNGNIAQGYTLQNLQDMLAKGSISDNTLAWKPGMNNWTELSKILGTENAATAPVPPPLP